MTSFTHFTMLSPCTKVLVWGINLVLSCLATSLPPWYVYISEDARDIPEKTNAISALPCLGGQMGRYGGRYTQ